MLTLPVQVVSLLRKDNVRQVVVEGDLPAAMNPETVVPVRRAARAMHATMAILAVQLEFVRR